MKRNRFGISAVLPVTPTVLLLFAGLISCPTPAAGVFPGQTERISDEEVGPQGNGPSYSPSITANGRFVAFESVATNLVPGDTNDGSDVFVHHWVTGTMTRVSVDSAGNQGNMNSGSPSISADGRFVAFHSVATNLVPGDTNDGSDVFVHDRLTGTTTRVSVDSAGNQGNLNSHSPSISADGRFVAFHSSSVLVAGDTNGTINDVFVHDRGTGATTLVSVDSAGIQGNLDSYSPSISADGRYVAFYSAATNLVPGDTNGADFDVFVRDRQTGTTTLVSVDSAGIQGSGVNYVPSISANGRFVSFISTSTNLVAGDTNGTFDVFVHDRGTGTTTRVSVDSAGVQGNGMSDAAYISADGRYVGFESYSSNLVAGDTNLRADAFLHDRQTGKTSRVSVDGAGNQGNNISYLPSVSADGRFVVFASAATNLVAADNNDSLDVFFHAPEIAWYKGELLNADFEADTPGTTPGLSPRGLPGGDSIFISGTDNTNSIRVASGIPDNAMHFGSNYLEVHKFGPTPITPLAMFLPDTSGGPLNGPYYSVSWRMAVPDSTFNNGFFWLEGDGGTMFGVRYLTGSILLLCNDGSWIDLGPYTPFEPDQFTAVIDFAEGNFWFFRNGNLITSTATWLDPVGNTSIYSAQFTIYGGNTETYGIDDVRIIPTWDGSDGDGVDFVKDNCPMDYNPDQADSDGDGIGDVCDLCETAFDPGQPDSVLGFPPDACDDDIDDDGVPDKSGVDLDADLRPDAWFGVLPVGEGGDNCPYEGNPDQADADGDRIGDACVPVQDAGGAERGNTSGTATNTDPDADLVPNNTGEDNCPNDKNPRVPYNTTGIPTYAWYVISGGNVTGWTTILDGTTPRTSGQPDFDLDGRGDRCDNCPRYPNPGQTKPSWYEDRDGDRYPSSAAPVTTADCTPPSSFWVEASTLISTTRIDCDDARADVNPGATERYDNGLDDDCNLATPDARPRVVFSPVFAPTDKSGSATLMGPGDKTGRIATYDTWLPTGDGTDPAATVRIEASVTGGTASDWAIAVDAVSQEPGTFMNDPNDLSGIDNDYVVVANIPGTNEITVRSNDYGGYVTVRASVTIDGIRYTERFTLPKGGGPAKVPDPWVNYWNGIYPGMPLIADADGDIDTSAGSTSVGDGLTNFKEFRGFKWGQLVRVEPEADARYQTTAFLPKSSPAYEHFRTDPVRKDLFVLYENFGSSDPLNVHNTTFAIGAAFDDARIDVHALDNAVYYPNRSLIDKERHIDTLYVYNQASGVKEGDGHINHLGIRDWTWDTKGYTETFGDFLVYGSGCKTYLFPLQNYFGDNTYIDRSSGTDLGRVGKLDPINLNYGVEDKNDNGLADTIKGDAEADDCTKAGCTTGVDGDWMAIGRVNAHLSPFDIDKDGFVELPVYSNPDNTALAGSGRGTDESTKAQVIKHTITHEMGHAVGIYHTQDASDLMWDRTPDWRRDNRFKGVSNFQIKIHNQ